MTNVLRDASRPAIIAALDENWCDCIRAFGRAPGVEVHEDEQILWFTTGIPDPSFNSVQRARMRPDRADALIDTTIALFEERGVPGGGWLVGPLSGPLDLRQRLRARGLDQVTQVLGMAADLDALVEQPTQPAELQILPVTDTEMLFQWSETEKIAFEATPLVGARLAEIRMAVGVGEHLPLRHYLGLLAGKPVATGSLHFAAGVAGIYDVATVPTARRRGIGAAMTHALMRDAHALGYRFAVLQPTAMGLRLYQRLGFSQYSVYDVYV